MGWYKLSFVYSVFFTEEKMYTKSKPQKKCFGLVNIFSMRGVMDENLPLVQVMCFIQILIIINN